MILIKQIIRFLVRLIATPIIVPVWAIFIWVTCDDAPLWEATKEAFNMLWGIPVGYSDCAESNW